jgi:hypothetical protein
MPLTLDLCNKLFFALYKRDEEKPEDPNKSLGMVRGDATKRNAPSSMNKSKIGVEQ